MTAVFLFFSFLVPSRSHRALSQIQPTAAISAIDGHAEFECDTGKVVERRHVRLRRRCIGE